LANGHAVSEVASYFSISETTVRKYGGRALARKATAMARARAKAEDLEDFFESISWSDDEEEAASNKQLKEMAVTVNITPTPNILEPVTVDNYQKTIQEEIQLYEKEYNLKRLLNILSRGKKRIFRQRVAIALGRLGDWQAVQPLIQALKDPTGPRKEAAWALGMIGAETAIRPLVDALLEFERKNDTSSAAETILAISRISSLESLPILLDLLKDEKNSPRIQQVAISLLGRLGDARAIPVLLDLLKKECNQTQNGLRDTILCSLSQINDEQVIEPLVEILSQVDKEFKERILEELVGYGELAEGPLKKLLTDTDPFVREKVSQILNKRGE